MNGLWAIRYSSGGATITSPTNQSGDIPAPADYDGDGKADRAVYRQSTSQWIIPNSGGGQTVKAVGTGSVDLPVLAPYSIALARVTSSVSSSSRAASVSFDMGSQAASLSSSTSAPASSSSSSTPKASAISTPVTSDATPTTSTPPAQAAVPALTPAQQHRQHVLELAAARRARRASILRGLAAKFHKA
jgi:hypothetical protein